jgi:hypothetical protein
MLRLCCLAPTMTICSPRRPLTPRRDADFGSGVFFEALPMAKTVHAFSVSRTPEAFKVLGAEGFGLRKHAEKLRACSAWTWKVVGVTWSRLKVLRVVIIRVLVQVQKVGVFTRKLTPQTRPRDESLKDGGNNTGGLLRYKRLPLWKLGLSPHAW